MGRREDLDAVAAALTAPGRAGAVITGPAGVGKTRLLDECVALAEQAGHACIRSSGSTLMRELPLGALSHLVPPGIPPDTAALVAAARTSIHERAAGRPAVLAIDDAHLLDDVSLLLVQQLVLAHEACVLVTSRDGEPVPSTVMRLWQDGYASLVELAPLDVDQVGALLHMVLRGPVDRAAALFLSARAQGNALFLRELVTGALADGSLALRDGRWSLTGSPTPTARLREVVAARLAPLGPAERQALDVLAVAEHLGHDELAALSPDADIAALEELGLVRIVPDGRRVRIEPAHPIHAEVLRAQLPVLRGNKIRRQLADHLDRCGGRRPQDIVRIASWRLDAGDRADAEVLLRGARLARAAHDYRRTIWLAEAALDAGPSAAAALLAGEAHYLIGDIVEADASLQTAARLATSDTDRVAVTMAWVDVRFWGLDDPSGAEALLETTAAEVPNAAALCRAKLASLRTFQGRPKDALAELAGLVGEEMDLRTQAQVHMATGLALALSGAAIEARQAAERAVATSETLAGPAGLVHPTAHAVTMAMAAAAQGYLDDAATTIGAAYEQAATDRLPFVTSWTALMAARVAALRAELPAALTWADGLVAAATDAGLPALARWGAAITALAAIWSGDGNRAGNAVSEAELGEDCGASLFDTEVERAKAWLLARDGHRDAAVARLRESALDAIDRGAAELAMHAAHDAVRLGQPSAGLDVLARCATLVEGPLSDALLAHGTAVSEGDLDALEHAATSLEELGADLLAAEAWAAASTLAATTKQARRAAAAASHVARLRACHPDIATPGLVVAPSAAPLTPREREIALLVADGLTSREVADRLVLSVRTVDNHLHRAFTKLGITRRSDLSTALGHPAAGKAAV